MIENAFDELGPLETVHKIERPFGFLLLTIIGLVVGLFIYFLLRYADAPLCIPVPLFVFGWVLIEFLTRRRTEFRFYQHGCKYRQLFRSHKMLWNDVEEFGHLLASDAEIGPDQGQKQNVARRARGDYVWLQSKDGKKFYIRPDLAGIKELIDRISIKLFGEPYYEN